MFECAMINSLLEYVASIPFFWKGHVVDIFQVYMLRISYLYQFFNLLFHLLFFSYQQSISCVIFQWGNHYMSIMYPSDGVTFELDFVIGKDFHKFKSNSSHISLFWASLEPWFNSCLIVVGWISKFQWNSP